MKRKITIIIFALLPFFAFANLGTITQARKVKSYEKTTHPLIQGFADLIVQQYDSDSNGGLETNELNRALKDIFVNKLLPPPNRGHSKRNTGERGMDRPPMGQQAPEEIVEMVSEMMESFDSDKNQKLNNEELSALIEKVTREAGPPNGRRMNKRSGATGA